LPQSATLWIASASIAPDPVGAAAPNFATTITRLTTRFWTMCRVES